jgi:hypothetical protein
MHVMECCIPIAQVVEKGDPNLALAKNSVAIADRTALGLIEQQARGTTMPRVGVLLVHGIGDQRRYQHLQNVVERLVRALVNRYGSDNVAVELPGVNGDASAIIHSDGRETIIDFTEMWWRDLGQRPTLLLAKLGFWLWAISLPGTKGYFTSPIGDRVNPESDQAQKEKLDLKARIGLALRTTCIFVLLSPAAMILRLAELIPGVRTVPFMHSVFTYLSSVQLYQERSVSQPGALTDFDQARRISIQRRMANLLINMSQQNYERWYIPAHSLGSVIALKSLMYDGVTFARFMPIRLWRGESLDWLKPEASKSTRPDAAEAAENTANFGGDEYVDCPKRPGRRRVSRR